MQQQQKSKHTKRKKKPVILVNYYGTNKGKTSILCYTTILKGTINFSGKLIKLILVKPKLADMILTQQFDVAASL